MKRLFIIRHAKSDWTNLNLEDFDRPLNEKGKNNLNLIAKKLSKKNICPDLIISSPAFRARETAKVLAQTIGYSEEIMYNEYLYEASLKTVLDIVNYIDDEYDDVFLVGHNPGLNLLAFYFVDFNENLPTCGVIELKFKCNSWREVCRNNAKLVSFEYPKKYTKKSSLNR